MYTQLTQPYLVASQCDMINFTGKIVITSEKKIIKNSDYLTNIPTNTCNTMAWVHGVSQCAKIQNHTCSHGTCFGNTMGIPVPVLNPTRQSVHEWETEECRVRKEQEVRTTL